MFILKAISYIKPERRDEFVALVVEQIENSRREAGSIHYTCGEDLSEPGAFHWLQGWTDYEAWVAHEATEHNKRFLARLERLRDVTRGTQAHMFDAEPRD